MIELKKNRIKKCGWHISSIFLLSLLVVFLIPGKQGMANNELSTVADIALYQAKEGGRNRIMIDG